MKKEEEEGERGVGGMTIWEEEIAWRERMREGIGKSR